MQPFSMSYIYGEDHGQAALLPAAIEDYISRQCGCCEDSVRTSRQILISGAIMG
jgi:hypothetical protein